MGKLLIVGTMAFDAIETPFGKTGKILGGAGTFIGLAASQFKIDSAIVSVVGDDFPQSYMDILQNKDIDLSGVEVVVGGKTFFWEGKYHNDLNSRDTFQPHSLREIPLGHRTEYLGRFQSCCTQRLYKCRYCYARQPPPQYSTECN